MRQPKLSGEQMRRFYTLIAGTDPRQLEFGFALWTGNMVRTLTGTASSSPGAGQRHLPDPVDRPFRPCGCPKLRA